MSVSIRIVSLIRTSGRRDLRHCTADIIEARRKSKSEPAKNAERRRVGDDVEPVSESDADGERDDQLGRDAQADAHQSGR